MSFFNYLSQKKCTYLVFWEKETIFNNIDVCVIGSGIVGLNAAINLKLIAPKLNVVVIDRGFIPYGASTRNAGFACFGSMTELIDDLSKESEEAVFKRIELRWHGLQKLRNLLGDVSLDYEPLGGYEVFSTSDTAAFEIGVAKMEYFNRMLKPLTGTSNTYSNADEKINEFGFNNVNHMVLNQCEGQINTGKMMEALVNLAHKTGVKIINGLSISAVHNSEKNTLINCEDGFSFKSKRTLIANNGFAAALLPEIAVVPARAQVLITEPIPNLKIKGSFHFEKGYYYFRNVGNRVLLGGGRNLDFKGETTAEFGTTTIIQNKLEALLNEMILPDAKYTIEMRWSGIMGVGESKSTIVRQVEGNLYCAVRMGGMGVAIGSLIGEMGAKMILESL
ncbi:MAG: FAD-binding oxidoreductase [Bacteroidetes bacterium]|nr:FAD-binding oxidoreductase [Bacteroidota bacterium]